jgi:two-component system, sensor histidine kinase PdtaS
MANLTHITRCGLPGMDRVPFGMHACHFYSNLDQLVATLIPFFVAGQRGKERCLWIAAQPPSQREALQALRAEWDGIDDAAQSGALRMVDAVPLKGLDAVHLYLEEEERALAEGYSGLRIAGDTSFLAPGGGAALIGYEQALTACFNRRRIVALCNYNLSQSGEQQMSEVIHAHDCAFVHPDADRHLTMIPRFTGTDAERFSPLALRTLTTP